MKSFDDLVRLLDNATQYSYELDMETLGDPALCWRCDSEPADNPNGLCGPCGDVLRSDKPVTPPWATTFQEFVAVIAAGLAQTMAAITSFVEQLPPTAFLLDGPDVVVDHIGVRLSSDGERWPDVLFRPLPMPPLMPPVEVWYLDEVVVAGHAAIYRRRPS